MRRPNRITLGVAVGISITNDCWDHEYRSIMSPRSLESVVVPALMASSLFMQEIDLALLNTAIPGMSASLQVDPTLLSLAVTAYWVCATIFMPASGWVADRFGTRIIFQIAVGIFIVGSICCAVSSNFAGLTLSRCIQGVGGAFMVPVARLIVVKEAAPGSLVRSMIWFTTPSLLGGIIGAPLSGYLVTYLSWSSIFLVNLPTGLAAILLAGRYVPNYKEDSRPAFDLLGFVQVGLALGALLFGLLSIGRNVLPISVSMGLAAGGMLAMAHYKRATGRRGGVAILDFATLDARTFRITTAGGAVFVAGVGATMFMMPIFLQNSLGFSALDTGLLLMCGTFGTLAARAAAHWAIGYFGFARLMSLNSIATCAILAALSVLPIASAPAIAVLFAFAGAVRSIQYTCLNSAAYIGLKPHMLTASATFASVAQQVSFALGIGFGATLLEVSSRSPVVASVLREGPPMLPLIAVSAMTLLTAFFFARLKLDGRLSAGAARND